MEVIDLTGDQPKIIKCADHGVAEAKEPESEAKPFDFLVKAKPKYCWGCCSGHDDKPRCPSGTFCEANFQPNQQAHYGGCMEEA